MLLAARCRCNHLFLGELVFVLSSITLLSHVFMLNPRAGVSRQAWLSGELFLRCYADLSPIEDVVHCICKSALLVGMPNMSDIRLLIILGSWLKEDNTRMLLLAWKKLTKKL